MTRHRSDSDDARAHGGGSSVVSRVAAVRAPNEPESHIAMSSSTPLARLAGLLRSDRVSASLMLAAAVLGLILANAPTGDALLGLRDTHLAIPAVGIDLSIGHWVTDGLLAIFFFIVATELRHELVHGDLNSPKHALAPAVAALGGVLVPALIFVAFTAGTDQVGGWPIPTATDIAFALGVLALIGKGLPSGVRVFLLALAILDDLIGILLIAVLFATDLQPVALAAAAVGVALFALLGQVLRRSPGTAVRVLTVVAMTVLGVVVWYFVHDSGIHATIAGVALGLVLPGKQGDGAASAIQPFSNVLVLPVFAFSAALVPVAGLSLSTLEPVFWGIAVALVVGKLVGITAAGYLVTRLTGAGMHLGDLLAVGALGGIGFTVALLMNELAFVSDRGLADQGALGVLVGSGLAVVVAVIIVRLRVRISGRHDD